VVEVVTNQVRTDHFPQVIVYAGTLVIWGEKEYRAPWGMPLASGGILCYNLLWASTIIGRNACSWLLRPGRCRVVSSG
jgi:hypothetical protein